MSHPQQINIIQCNKLIVNNGNQPSFVPPQFPPSFPFSSNPFTPVEKENVKTELWITKKGDNDYQITMKWTMFTTKISPVTGDEKIFTVPGTDIFVWRNHFGGRNKQIKKGIQCVDGYKIIFGNDGPTITNMETNKVVVLDVTTVAEYHVKQTVL